MASSQPHKQSARALQLTAVIGAAPLMGVALSGCLVAGYSSRGGFFIWPGSIVFFVILALLYFFLRGR